MSNIKKPSHGGKRTGAGRPPGSGKYGEPTVAIRVPSSLASPLQSWLASLEPHKPLMPQVAFKAIKAHQQTLPFFENKIAAGFPSPADNHLAQQLDLNDYVIKNPATTFYVQVEGDSMINAGIHPNDLLVVDRSLTPHNGNIIIAFINGEFTVKRLRITGGKEITLLPENDNYSPIHVKEGMDFRVWGVVRSVIHSVF